MVEKITSSSDISNLGLDLSKKNLVITKDSQSAVQFANFLNHSNAFILDNSELLPYDFFSMAPITRARRISTLSAYLKDKEITLISSIATLLSPVPQPIHVSPLNNLSVGDPFDPESVIDEITLNGYTREDFVSVHGHYALRGSVMDIFLTSGKEPIRIEFFNSQIESLRTFNPESQITNEKINHINFLPSYEYPLNRNSAEIFKKEWRKRFELFEEDSELFTRIMNLRHPEGAEIYFPLFYGTKSDFIPFLQYADQIYIQDNVNKKAHDFEELVNQRYEEYRYDQKRPLLAPEDLFLSMNELSVCIKDSLTFDIETDYSETIENNIPKNERKEKADISSSKMPDKGDLVVHLTHGIGKFLGLKQLKTFVGVSDCLEILYKDESKVFVPIEHMNLISKYFGPVDRDIDSLNSKKWQKRKDKALKQTFDTAAELLEVQAKRYSSNGYSFDLYENDYLNFIKKFPYEETYDQKRTIEEVLFDMKAVRPMDRLICGEVGFGKTEVAMRAAFVSAMNSKQTCILVPTTLLASQHFSSFEERFKDTGINISLLSRNVSQKDKENLLEADEVNLDLVSKTSKIYMKDKTKKVKARIKN